MSDEHSHSHPPSPSPEPGRPGPTGGGRSLEDGSSEALAGALKSSFRILKVVMIIMVICLPFSNWFQVKPQQKAVILRFGKPLGEGKAALLSPGLHWAYPYPIDKVETIPYSESQTITSTSGGEIELPQTNQPPPRPSLSPAMDNYVITGDGNILQTRATVAYRVDDPIRYHFDFVDAGALMQEIVDNALVDAAGHFNVDDILRHNPVGFQEAVQNRVAELARAEGLGVVVESCLVQSRPPRYLTEAFNRVLAVETQVAETNNAAILYSNRIVIEATANATGLTNQAGFEREQLLASVKADADSFRTNLPIYEINPGLYTQSLLLEELGKTLTNVHAIWYIPQPVGGKPWQIRLDLSPELREPGPPPAANPNTVY